MNAIVSVSPDWGIGKDNHLLFRISADLKRFRQLTAGKTVIMGRATLATLPGGAPLKDRNNIILSSDPSFHPEGALVCRSPEEALAAAAGFPTEDVFVIGGESVYRTFLSHCERIYVTRIWSDAAADRFFPDLDRLGWPRLEESPLQEESGLRFQYVTYENPDR